MVIEWNNLRTMDGSNHNAFEELCCQLARYEMPINGSEFFRKGTPDAGVECYWVLPNGDEWGWQAKFFTKTPENAQWKQLDESVDTVLDKHPRMVKYIICLPLDRADSRIEKQKSFMDKWNERVSTWTKKAHAKGINIKFVYWGTSEIFHRLSQDNHRGRYLFWFNKDQFSKEWFKEKLTETMENIGAKNIDKPSIEQYPGRLFDSVTCADEFINSVKDGCNINHSNSRALLLVGNESSQITKLLYKLAEMRLDSNQPTILLLGRHFNNEEPWSQILKLLDVKTTKEELLSILNTLGETSNCKVLIIIDALNEGQGRHLWHKYIAGFIESLKKYKWLRLVISTISAYEKAIIPDHIGDKLIRVPLNGSSQVPQYTSPWGNSLTKDMSRGILTWLRSGVLPQNRVEGNYCFVETIEQMEILTKINYEAFKSSAFRVDEDKIYLRNSSIIKQNKYSFLLMIDPITKRDYIGYSCLLPLTKKSTRLYLDGSIKDSDITGECIEKEPNIPDSILIFAIVLKPQYSLAKSGADKMYSIYFWSCIMQHIILFLEKFSDSIIPLYAQTEIPSLTTRLKRMGFDNKIGKKTANGFEIWQFQKPFCNYF